MSLASELQTATQLAQQGRHKAAFKAARIGMKRYKSHPAFPNLAGVAACALGKERDAVPLFQMALKLEPGFVDARRNLGQALLALERPEAAMRHLSDVLAQRPKDHVAHYVMAAAQSRAGAYAAARETLNALAALGPMNANALALRSEVYDCLGHTQLALEDVSQALGKTPDSASLWARQSELYAKQAQPEQALQSIERAITCNSQDDALQLRLVAQLLAMGQLEEALARLRQVLDRSPENVAAIEQMAKIGTDADREILLERAEALRSRRTMPPDARGAVAFALASLSQPGSKEEAAYLSEGNRTMARLAPYDRSREETLNAAIVAKTRARLPEPQLLNPRPVRPIFVLGLPRSGTTLTEAVLGAHPAVVAMGERHTPDLLLPFVRDERRFDATSAAQFVEEDQSALPELPDGTQAYVDKMPENHRWVGFLKSAYPDCRIIHMRRDPRDIALSMWRSRFPTGAMGYTYDWKAMAHRFNLYAQIMAHWNGLYPGAILELRYEALVTDIEEQSRRVAEFCDLNWVEEMTRPDLHAGQVRTQSVYQLRQPVHRRSVGRWKRDVAMLEPFLAELETTLWPDVSED